MEHKASISSSQYYSVKCIVFISTMPVRIPILFDVLYIYFLNVGLYILCIIYLKIYLESVVFIPLIALQLYLL